MSLLKRLWRPGHPLFWLWLVFNVLGAGCAWAMRLPGLNALGLMLFAALALGNAGLGLWAAWQLLRTAPQPGQPPR